MEKGVFAAQRADLRLGAVGEHEKGVIIKQVGNRVQIIGVIIHIGVLHIHIVVFQLHKQQRNAVDKADDVGAAMIVFAVNLHFLDREKAIVIRVEKVDDSRPLDFGLAAGSPDRHGNTVADEGVFFLVDLHERSGGKAIFKYRLGFDDLLVRDPRVEFLEGSAKIPRQQDFFVVLPTQRSVDSQFLGVVGKNNVPAQLVPQQISRALLHEDIFGIVLAHEITPLLLIK